MRVKKYSFRYFLSWCQNHGLFNYLPDKQYCSIVLYARTGKFPNYKNPKNFNEKLQWLKLNYRDDKLTKLVDKYEARKIVEESVGAEYLVPLHGVWSDVDDIDISKLPEQFVLKCNHDGGIIVCKDKKEFNFNMAKKKLASRMKINYYSHAREWPYKNIVPCVICEEYLKDGEYSSLPVYKFLCFDGEPRLIQTIQNDKMPNETVDYFDMNWELQPIRQNYNNSQIPLPKPISFDEMKEVVKKLCIGYPFIRIDLYQVNGKVYFSEFTLYSDAGFEGFSPDKWDSILGEWIKLP